MNYGPLIFLGAFFALSASWLGFIVNPQVQVGRLQQTNTVPASALYPLARPGLARQGLQVYRANGCAYCHSQQVRQSGVVCDLLVTESGTNYSAFSRALRVAKPDLTDAQLKEFLTKLPKALLVGAKRSDADAAARALKTAGAKSEIWILPTGPDIARNWGKRRSVAEDFLYDSPVQPGSQRVGPDLADVGARLPDANWHLRHLYAPKLDVKESVMPPYRFLFEKRKIQRVRSPDALSLPPELSPGPGYEIVPRPDATALAAYLTSLRTDAPLFVAPLSVPMPKTSGTNAPGETNAAPAAATNATPAK